MECLSGVKAMIAPKVFLIAGELSGDALGASLMRALEEQSNGAVQFQGVGGALMQGQGLCSLFPMTDLSVMGIVPVLKRLPLLLRRIRETADAVLRSNPNVLVLIDAPDFTHRVAKRVRKQNPSIKIVHYVSPTVWAWRPGRAAKMARFVDKLLAVLPFEPEVHRKLGGPPTVFVGHPLVEKLPQLVPSQLDELRRAASPPLVVVLPGSRRSEVQRLMPVFSEALQMLRKTLGDYQLVLPAVGHLRAEIERQLEAWPIKPTLLDGEADKYQAFRQARGALAASGTVTLELALAQVPMAVAYKVSWIETPLKYVVKIPSMVLANLILGRNIYPEFLQEKCTPQALHDALLAAVQEGEARTAQIEAGRELAGLIQNKGENPSAVAAREVMSLF